GEAVAGRQVGRRAMLWGAVCGTFPDLDIFIPLGDAVRDFTYHRSFSHSLFVLAALTPLFVWLILKLHPGTRHHRVRWAVLVYAVFATHVLLDCFTVYGTQILWPFVTTPVGWSTVFIIDPLYTLPLALGLVAILSWRSEPQKARRLNTAGLVLSTLYLGWTVAAKLEVERTAREALAAVGLADAPMLSTPAPFNSMLWRIVVMTDDGYLEGFRSMLDGVETVRFSTYPSATHLLEGLEATWSVRRLQWFTKGFYRVRETGGSVVMTDLRMGLEPHYVFNFVVGEVGNPHARPIVPVRRPGIRDYDRLHWVWERIWDPAAA
ncbi:MAG: metal-dependent hydrolase, partial [Gammaproteobacteria bacterium]|nr:metal-dependent hydrolase [Gammaproteobacteria bacterium]